MNSDYSTRIKVGTILLILFALVSNVQLFKQTATTFDSKSIGSDEITLYEKRFKGLKEMLSSHNVVGYITNKCLKDLTADAEATMGYYLTQYTLSPVIVVNDPERQLVVGNFHNTATIPKISTKRNLILLKDFGNGVMLFRREVK